MPPSRRWLAALLVSWASWTQGEARAQPQPQPQPQPRSRPEAALPASGQRLRVFFSGHSLLDNPLPDWIELIARSRGDSLGWQQQIVLGSPIRVRTKGNDPDAQGFSGYQLGKSKGNGAIDVLRELAHPAALAAGEKYDRLVINERNDLVGAVHWENTIGYLRDFEDRLFKENPRASALLYQVWPDIDKAAPDAWLAYTRQELLGWECVAARVNRGLEKDGRPDRVSLAPGGLALTALVERALAGAVPGVTGSPRQRLDAIFVDDLHLRPLGIYLLSAVHYAALFGKSPAGAASPPEVSAAAPLLQQIAWDSVSSQRARPTPTAAECSARFATELCPAYQRFWGRPSNVRSCKSWSEPDNPFSANPAIPTRTPSVARWGTGLATAVLLGAGYLWQRRAARARRAAG